MYKSFKILAIGQAHELGLPTIILVRLYGLVLVYVMSFDPTYHPRDKLSGQ
jgi:hypothetical protein